ncbi:MAG: mechanosensitive ion channel family protein [Rhodothermales bacterium]
MPSRRTTTRRTTQQSGRRSRRRIRSAVSGRARRLRTVGSAKAGAERSLRGFRQATVLAVAITSLLVFFVPDAGEGATPQQPDATLDTLVVDSVGTGTMAATPAMADSAVVAPEFRADSLARETTTRARQAFTDIWYVLVRSLPKLIVAFLILFLAWLIVRLIRPLVRRVLGRWEKAAAVTALFGIAVWLIAVSIAVGVIAGDFRALLGSLGLVGLALSWALQTPIESFTGWLLNSFQGYYRVGDRIAVGEVFGDVYRIDFLTTTVWEYGGPDRPPSFIQAEQATGRLITFPNNEVLTGSIVNYTRDFDFVWDELSISIAPESDVRYAAGVAERVAHGLLHDYMVAPAARYREILQRAGLPDSVAEDPTLYFSMTDWSINLTVRYLVGARERRKWKSELVALLVEEFGRPEHADKILTVYPRQQLQLVEADGTITRWPVGRDGTGSPPSESA